MRQSSIGCYKKCNVCNTSKDVLCFSVQKHGALGVRPRCKECDAKHYRKAKPVTQTIVPSLDGEIWVDINGLEECYQVSNFARVKGLDRWITHARLGPQYIRGRIIKCRNSNGYRVVSLRKDSKETQDYRVHRLVAEAFIPNAENKPEVNHKNGIRNDNRI